MDAEDQANNYGPPLFSHAFERFIKDYESGFKSVQAVDVGKFKNFTSVQALRGVKIEDGIAPKAIAFGLAAPCFRQITEIDKHSDPDVFEPWVIETDLHEDIESLEDEFIGFLLQSCPVDKNRNLFWRHRPELNIQESFDERKKNCRIYARVFTAEGELIDNQQSTIINQQS